MALNIKEFAASLGFAGEDLTAFEALMGKQPKAVEELERQTLRKSELDRLAGEYAQKQREAEDLSARLATWQQAAEGELGTARTARQAAEARALKMEQDLIAIRQRAKRLAEDNGLESEEWMKEPSGAPNLAPVQTQSVTPPNFDPNRYVPREDFDKTLLGTVDALAELADLQEKHRELWGKGFSNAEFVAHIKDEAKRGHTYPNLTAAWETKFEVGKKRDELAEAKVQQRIKEAVDAKEREVIERVSLPGEMGIEQPVSQILRDYGARPPAPISADTRPKPGERFGEVASFSRAMARFNAEKLKGRTA